jgi:ribosomal protein S18 acetylase RimI-like enzyme
MSVSADAAVLDNVVWHSVSGAHRELAEHEGRAGRFLRDVAPFSGLDHPSDPDAWVDLAKLVGAGKPAIVFLPNLVPPPGWVVQHEIVCFQMVADGVDAISTSEEIVELGRQDVGDMLSLIASTQPGPFSERTIELGRYAGIRRDGRLVAMTGERFRCPGFTEVSAVCTSEDVRGQGLARELVVNVIAAIRARGDEAFLHVETKNTPAIGLYESMGFTKRFEGAAFIVRNTKDA